jgi:hypothetical protein
MLNELMNNFQIFFLIHLIFDIHLLIVVEFFLLDFLDEQYNYDEEEKIYLYFDN